MKKVKMMLIATAVLATVGGALAFKANKFGLVRFYTTTAANPNQFSTCNLPTSYTILPQAEGGFVTSATITSGQPCIKTTVTTVEP